MGTTKSTTSLPAPSYSAYSLSELEDALVHIDRAKFPERALLLERLVQDRRKELANRGPDAGHQTPGRAGALVKQVRVAAILAFVISGMTAVAQILGLLYGGEVARAVGAPWGLVDVVCLSFFGWFVLRGSRTAAILLVAYYVGARTWFFFQTGRGLGLSVVVTALLCLGVVGTFRLHRTRGPSSGMTPHAGD